MQMNANAARCLQRVLQATICKRICRLALKVARRCLMLVPRLCCFEMNMCAFSVLAGRELTKSFSNSDKRHLIISFLSDITVTLPLYCYFPYFTNIR